MPTPKYKEDKFYIGLTEIYSGYTHRYRDVTSNTVPVPYVPVKDISTHEYKMTFKEWKKLAQIYLKNIFLFLLTGKEFYIPARLGTWQIMKIQRRGVDRNESKKAGKTIFFRNIHTYGYKPRIVWMRNKAVLLFKSYYKFNLIRTQWADMAKILKADGSKILNFRDR